VFKGLYLSPVSTPTAGLEIIDLPVLRFLKTIRDWWIGI